MKRLVYLLLALTQTFFVQAALAEETPANAKEIPIMEQDFIKVINNFSKEQIIAQFGEPAQADDVKIKGTNKIVASIWQYHFINTDAEGTYYETTELDFIDDKVVMVAFLNNDGVDKTEQPQQYEIPVKSR